MGADVPLALALILMIVGILLCGDDDLPGPRRSFARAMRGGSPF